MLFRSVGKTGAGVDHHTGRIDLAQEALGVHVVGGHDGIGVVAAVGVDVRNRLVQPRHNFDADDGREVLFKPILFF